MFFKSSRTSVKRQTGNQESAFNASHKTERAVQTKAKRENATDSMSAILQEMPTHTRRVRCNHLDSTRPPILERFAQPASKIDPCKHATANRSIENRRTWSPTKSSTLVTQKQNLATVNFTFKSQSHLDKYNQSAALN